jgi:hypothetical protein
MNMKLVAFVNLCTICNKQFSRYYSELVKTSLFKTQYFRKDHLKTHLRNVHKQRIKVINPAVLENSSDEELSDNFEDDEPGNLDVKIKEEFDEPDSDVQDLDQSEEINEVQSDEEDEKPSFESVEKNDAKIPKIEIKTENEELLFDAPEKPARSERRKKRDREKDKHECETCKKVFSRATHLKRHLLTHSDIKPFQVSLG